VVGVNNNDEGGSMKFIEEYIGRIVVVLTPVFAGAAGWLATWAAAHLPGSPVLDAGEITAIFVVGVLAAVSAVISWLKGRREYEQNKQAAAFEVELIEEHGRTP
jgi:hypothetical protein